MHIGEKGNVMEPAVASRYLRAMGFYDKEPLAEKINLDTNPQAKVDLNLALARYQRSYGKEELVGFDNLMKELEKTYYSGK